MLNPEILKGILADLAISEKAPEAMVKLNDEAGQLFAKFDEVNNSLTEANGQISQLKDANSRLALKVTDAAQGGGNDGDPDEPETAEEAMEWLTKKIGGNE